MELIKTSNIKHLFKDERREDMQSLRIQKLSLEKIGKRYKLSRERVRQILLPSVEIVSYLFKCGVCHSEQATRSKNPPNCLECQQNRFVKKGFKKLILKDVFAGKPNWKRKGRERNREIIRYLYDYTCQTCGKIWEEGERSLDIHHLGGLCGKKTRGYDSLDDFDILLPLCHKCHFNHPEHTLTVRRKRKEQRVIPEVSVELSTHLPKSLVDWVYSKCKEEKKDKDSIVEAIIKSHKNKK